VDFGAFKARRASRVSKTAAAEALPLFDEAPVTAPVESSAALPGAAPRLSERQVRHRERMLRFLTAERPAHG
jgi:hypothetical protein